MSNSLVLRSDDGPVAVLTLNRPDRRNALSRALIAEFGDALSRVAADASVRAVVVTGAGSVFCAGMDLKEAAITERTAEAERRAVADVQALADLVSQLHRMPQATIAALNGDALAGGAGIATACDLVVAAEGVRLGYPEVRRGLVAAIVMHDLVRQVGDRRARQLLLTAEPIDAATAEAWGLINIVVPAAECRQRALSFARTIVQGAPKAVESTKRLLDEATRRPSDLRGPAAITAAIRVSDEAEEGMRAFLEKRPPRWSTLERRDRD